MPHLGKKEPFWSPHGPELLDISITNWCDKGCSICYTQSNLCGKHMSLADFMNIVDQAARMGTFQVALGGGNPNQHPDFIEILKYTALNGIVPNYTTNGRGLSPEIVKATREYCGAVAVSAYEPYGEASDAIKKLLHNGIKTNVHFVLDAFSIGTAIEWLDKPPEFLRSVNAIVFLNYKPVGRNVRKEMLLRNSPRLEELFRIATSFQRNVKVGFDACSVSGLLAYTNASPTIIDACDAGRFSMYISEDLKAYPCSFQRGLADGDKLDGDTSLLDVWLRSKNFWVYRRYFSSDRCKTCIQRPVCLNGCPIFDDLVVCGVR